MQENESFYYCLAYDANIDCIVMVLKGYFDSYHFRSVTEDLLQLIIKHRVGKVLADTSEMNLISADDQKWLNENFLPRAIQQGYKVCAMINSKYYFNRVSLRTIADKIDKSVFSIEFFEDKASAIAWLKKYRKIAGEYHYSPF